METLPDYLAPGLDIVSIGLNPSLNSVRAGFYFATPRNRFWGALNASALTGRELAPGAAAIESLFRDLRIGFTDLVKRPTRGAAELRAADYRGGVPVLADKLIRYQPCIAWFHGMMAWNHFRRYHWGPGNGARWGRQRQLLGQSICFVTPNPSPANAAFSLADLVSWYDRLAVLRDARRGRD